MFLPSSRPREITGTGPWAPLLIRQAARQELRRSSGWGKPLALPHSGRIRAYCSAILEQNLERATNDFCTMSAGKAPAFPGSKSILGIDQLESGAAPE